MLLGQYIYKGTQITIRDDARKMCRKAIERELIVLRCEIPRTNALGSIQDSMKKTDLYNRFFSWYNPK